MKVGNMILSLSVVALAVSTPAAAKNLFVSTTGDDSVAYEDNSIENPWLTPAKAFTSVAPGDTAFFRGGTYKISSTISTGGNVNPTSPSERVVFMNYQHECVVFDCISLPEGHTAVSIDRDYYEINGIGHRSRWGFLRIGMNASANHFVLKNSTGELTESGGPHYLRCLSFYPVNGDGGRVENCIFIGPEPRPPGGNTAGVALQRSWNVQVSNCEFYYFTSGILYQYPSASLDDETENEWAYNYFDNCYNGIATCASHVRIHNNLFVNSRLSLGYSHDISNPENTSGGYNRVYHNTVVGYYDGTGVIGNLRIVCDSSHGSVNNIIKNNVFTVRTEICAQYGWDHDTTTDWNLYPVRTQPPQGGAVFSNNTLHVSLAAWQAFYGQDLNSVSGSPEFVGGASPETIDGYALRVDSPGYLAASDGTNMGANIAFVGLQPRAPDRVQINAQ